MSKQIALLRGVNVGGRNKLPMNELKKRLEENGYENVRTYIQSGNIIYDAGGSSTNIDAVIETAFGFRPQTFILSASALKKAAAGCPFRRQGEADPKSVHLTFLSATPPKTAAMEFNLVKTPEEEFSINGKVLYLHSPNGLKASNIAEKAARILKVKTTARNWNTIAALIHMLDMDA